MSELESQIRALQARIDAQDKRITALNERIAILEAREVRADDGDFGNFPMLQH